MREDDEIINVENLQKYTKNHIKAILVIFIIILGLVSLFFAKKINQEKKEIAKLQQEINRTDSIQTYIGHIQEVLAINFTDLDNMQAYWFAKIIYENSNKYNVEWELIASIIYYESGFNVSAVNPNSGCFGLMQLCSGTASKQAKKIGIVKPEYKDPFINIALGTSYIKELQDSKKTYDEVIKIYLGDKTNTPEAIRYRGGVKADYNRMKRMK